jgi:hypothetical protein
MQNLIRPEDLQRPVDRLVVELLDSLIPVPVHDHLRRVHQREFFHEPDAVTVLTDERVPVQQQLGGHR